MIAQQTALELATELAALDTDVPCKDVDIVARVAAGQFDADVLERLQRGFATHLAADRSISIERCLRSPRSAAGFQKMQRDRWLIEVAKEYHSETPWGRAGEVRKALTDFITRGPWRAWKDLEDPPAHTSNLRTALFRVCKCMKEPDDLSQKTILRVIGQIFS